MGGRESNVSGLTAQPDALVDWRKAPVLLPPLLEDADAEGARRRRDERRGWGSPPGRVHGFREVRGRGAWRPRGGAVASGPVAETGGSATAAPTQTETQPQLGKNSGGGGTRGERGTRGKRGNTRREDSGGGRQQEKMD